MTILPLPNCTMFHIRPYSHIISLSQCRSCTFLLSCAGSPLPSPPAFSFLEMESQLRGEFEGNHSTFLVRDHGMGFWLGMRGIAFVAALALVSLRCLPRAVCAI